MVINITFDAYNDIVTYYDNVLLAHPNTFDSNNAIQAIDEVYDGIIDRINGIIGNEREPLLQALNNGNTIELSFDKNGKRIWYFTLRIDGECAIVENAWHYTNASNRAYRRGSVNPNASISQDDRTNQRRKTITEKQLRSIIRETIERFFAYL